MFDIDKFADKFEKDEINDRELKLTNLYNDLFCNPYTHLGKIREHFDNASINELKDLFEHVLEADDENEYEYNYYIFGEIINFSIPIRAGFNNGSSVHYWKKLRNEKGFI